MLFALNEGASGRVGEMETRRNGEMESGGEGVKKGFVGLLILVFTLSEGWCAN